ncbi:hypothetical protein ANN_10249 [Periplaneta americana]|uniref:Uncharacterized protein n=1 Tax=Periplaneta americana TaxID=6978 RepID=A0ABQ8TR97_PERAM|nr:hypothetical protein ANN_10249 [Periplaneta americana]
MFNLPPLDPFEIKELKLLHGQGRGQLNLTLRDVKLLGLKDAYMLNYSHDLTKTSHSSFLLTVPELKVLGTYIISGQILLLPIRGTGNINITLVDTKCMVRNNSKIQKINGVDHIMLNSATVHLDPKRMYIHLDNLFNGDKHLASYFKVCARFDPNFGECVVKSSREVIPHIVKARMSESRNGYRVLVARPEGKRPFGRPSDGRIMLKWGVMVETGLILIRIGPMADLCWGGNELAGSLKAITIKH